MLNNEILSNNFLDLDDIANKERVNYLEARPFPNIVFENFFKNEFLNEVLKEFPDLSKIQKSQS